MKSILFIIALCLQLLSQGQTPHNDSILIENKINIELNTLKSELEKVSNHTVLSVEFTIDTSRIELELKYKLAIDYSTASMVHAAQFAESKYELLLSKYYNKLLSKIDNKDEKTIIESQNDWLQYRNSQKKMIVKLSEEKYSGGGSIQRVLIAGDFLGITKNRVIDLYRHLSSIEEEF